MKKAIAYVNDIALPGGHALTRSSQLELIRKHAAENEIELVAWFEDQGIEQDLLKRPGIQALLAYEGVCDMVLCERVWALSRSTAALEPFLRELDRHRWSFQSATILWDSDSQHSRRRFEPALSPLPSVHRAARRYIARKVKVARPARMNFAHLA